MSVADEGARSRVSPLYEWGVTASYVWREGLWSVTVERAGSGLSGYCRRGDASFS